MRNALLSLSETLPDMRYAAGADKSQVDPVRRLVAAASTWGLAIYLNVFPEKNDGKTADHLTVGEVLVDAFWSITVYSKDGYFRPNALNAYSINSITRSQGDGPVRRLQQHDAELPAGHDGLELHGAPVSSAGAYSGRQLEVPRRGAQKLIDAGDSGGGIRKIYRG
ncbi:TPA: DUF1214 domain-containing protein [Stenotrophomonas maltophilia]|nr:DUF1214 domain-containing protein [Stenotrophomonas maltophilia]